MTKPSSWILLLPLATVAASSTGEALVAPGEPTVLHVDDEAPGGDGSSWATAFRHLSDALSASEAGDQIWVARGTYRPSDVGDRGASFHLAPGVSLYGGFLGVEASLAERAGLFSETVLSGDLNDDDGADLGTKSDNSYHVVRSSTAALARLDGFTVRGGFARDAALPADRDGGGLWIEDGVLLVANCFFEDNLANNGGAVYNDGEDVSFVRCTFDRNRAEGTGGAVINIRGLEARYTSCRFLQNESEQSGDGGAVGNLTAGVNPTLDVHFVNCLFTGNSAPNGATVYRSGAGQNHFHGCTFANNSGGIRVLGNGGSVIVSNSILWQNGGAGQVLTDDVTLTVSRSCLSAPLPPGGLDLLDTDPLFIDADGPDDVPGNGDDELGLAPNSPCLDAGSAADLPADSADLDEDGSTLEPLPVDLAGAPRTLDGNGDAVAEVDMGALERSAGVAFLDLDQGESVTLVPSGGSGDPLEDSLVTILNESGGDGAGVTVQESQIDLHPTVGGFAGVGTTVTVETDLQDGEFVMTVSIPFDVATLGGADPSLLDLAYFDPIAQQWRLAPETNVSDSPGFAPGTKIGNRCCLSNGGPCCSVFPPDGPVSCSSLGSTPSVPVAPCSDLGDYGVFIDPGDPLDPSDDRGFVWATVDHATDFALGRFQALPYGCDVNPAGSLFVLSGEPHLGSTLTVAVNDPLESAGSTGFAGLFTSLQPDANYPCGTSLPGFGMAGPSGELLVNLLPPDPVALVGPVLWEGSAQPVPFPLGLPADPTLAGIVVYLQGLVVGSRGAKLGGALRVPLVP